MSNRSLTTTRDSSSTRQPDAWERWLWIFHVIAYLALAGSVFIAATDSGPRPISLTSVLTLSAFLGLWYAGVMLSKYEFWALYLPYSLLYFAAGWGAWIWLANASPHFMMLAAMIYPATFIRLPMCWATGTAVTMTGVLVAAALISRGAAASASAIGLGIALLPAIGLAVFISSIISQSHERRELIRKLQATQDELARTERDKGALQERERLAREIHDTLAQGFTSIVMHLETAEQALPEETQKVERHIDQARNTARESLEEARRLVWALRPEALVRASLPDALARLVQEWSAETGIAATANITGTRSDLLPEIEVSLLRAAQEALANIRRHAQAASANLTLSYMGDVVVLDVQDNGRGFDVAALGARAPGFASDGFGLTAMRQRAEQLGGSVVVESDGDGTTVVVEIPVPATAEQIDAR